MFSLAYISVCVYCIIQLTFLLVMDRRRLKFRLVKEQYFALLLLMMIFSFLADIVSSIQKPMGWLFPISASGNYIEIILNTWTLLVFFHYICTQIKHVDPKLKRRADLVLKVMGVACSLVVMSTLVTGQIFYYDEFHNYFRGPLFWLPMLILYGMMFLIEGFIVSQKAKIEVSHYQSLLFFLILPMIGSVFQGLIYGMPFSLMSATLAAQVVFTNVQNRSMDLDYLTGAFNRQALDHCLESKINGLKKTLSFSALLIDIDNFKEINDTYGHIEGDNALIHTVEILREALGQEVFISRYGGDEFCVVFNTDNRTELEAQIQRITTCLHHYNQLPSNIYPLEFSMGYDRYENDHSGSAQAFLKWIDAKMYADKNKRKAYYE